MSQETRIEIADPEVVPKANRRQFSDERIGFCLDLGHAALNGDDLERDTRHNLTK